MFLRKVKRFLPIYLFLLIFLPLILFGIPPLYGDDTHFLDTIKSHGIWHGVYYWLINYGVGYRPISITFLYFVYYLFGFSAWSLYLFSFILYGFFQWSIWYSFGPYLKTFHHRFFVLAFCSTFFLNPTAFLQLSSMGMVLGNACAILFISKLLQNYEKFETKEYFLYIFLWLILLFNYEQVVGLISLLPFWILFTKDGCLKKKVLATIKPSILFAIPTLIFLISYFLSQKNPKILTLKKFNKETTAVIPTKISIEEIKSNEMAITTVVESRQPKQIASLSTSNQKSRIIYLYLKIKKVFSFFLYNFKYFFLKLDSYVGLFTLVALCLAGITLCLRETSTRTNVNHALTQIFFGVLWTASTLGPFLLYKKVHVPPYVLLLPSAGIGLALIGLLNLLRRTFLVKLAIIFILVLGPPQQFAYLYGLNEELSFWHKMSSYIQKNELLKGKESLRILDVPKKSNMHIFWLEQAIGIRYFKSQLEGHAVDLSVHHNHHENLLLISRDNAPSIKEVNFKN